MMIMLIMMIMMMMMYDHCQGNGSDVMRLDKVDRIVTVSGKG